MQKQGKRRIKTKFLLFALVILMFTIVPFGIHNTGDTVQAAAKIKLNKTKLSIRSGTVYKIKLNGATASKVKWKSSNTKVATVTNGTIGALKKGTAKITATYNKKKYTCKVTVKYGTTKLSNGIVYEDKEGVFDTTGRWFPKQYYDKSYAFTNTGGSAIYFKASGTRYVKLRFLNLTSHETPIYAYSVDGKTFIRKKITSTKIDLGNTKTHYVRLVIDGLSKAEDTWNSEAGVGIMSVKGVTKGSVVTAIRPQNKLIAFYGDSITQGVRTNSSALTTSGTSAVKSYAFHCAQALNRIPFTVGFGGSGILEKGDFNQAVVTFQYQSASRPATTIDSDIIVMEYGTNDPLSKNITPGYKGLIEQIHRTNPNAQLIAMIPFNQAHAAQIRTAAASYSYCHVFETKNLAITYTDTNIHPNASSSATIGSALANFIKQL